MLGHELNPRRESVQGDHVKNLINRGAVICQDRDAVLLGCRRDRRGRDTVLVHRFDLDPFVFPGLHLFFPGLHRGSE